MRVMAVATDKTIERLPIGVTEAGERVAGAGICRIAGSATCSFLLLAPHQTGGVRSRNPHLMGLIDRALWDNRRVDPDAIERELRGDKGRGWLMRWLPTRAYENGVYYVFSNAVGVDHDTIKTGGAMIIDPFGEILAESHALGDDIVVGLCTLEKIGCSGGRRYLRARRPDLYRKLVEPPPEGQPPETNPGWRTS